MRIKKLRWMALTILFVAGCSGSKVIMFTGPKAKFQNYYTYRIQHPPYPEDTSAAIDHAMVLKKKVDATITIQLNSRGYSKIQPADLVVSYNLILENKVDYDVNNSYSRSRNYNYPYSYNYYNPYDPYQFNKKEYTQGTLIVEIREDFGNAIVWEGSLNLKYHKNKNRKRQDPVTNAFDLIFNEYNYIAGRAQQVSSENPK